MPDPPAWATDATVGPHGIELDPKDPMPDHLPDLNLTIPGTLRRSVARAVMGDRTDPERLRFAADLLDPALADDARYSPAPVDDEHEPAPCLTDAEQAAIDHRGRAVTYTDADGDPLRVKGYLDWGHFPEYHGCIHISTASAGMRLTIEHQQRLHALLGANLAKHGGR